MNTTDFLKANEHESGGAFISKAQYLKDNWSWLKYSYAISIKVRRRMKELGMTQTELAHELACTQQHISVLLGGRSNMTLETIAKLEEALSFDLIGRNLAEFGQIMPEQDSGYLNDSAEARQGTLGAPSSVPLVEGYKPRKKKGPKSR